MNDMICKKNECAGCYACVNICPKKAITMAEDTMGNIYPVIDNSKCVNCNMCRNTCPAINKVIFSPIKKCYAAFMKNKELRDESTSGGIASQLAYSIVTQNGVVYACSFVNGTIQHIRIDNKEDISLMKGSKYVHSYIKDSYAKAKQDLISSKFVLFIGTPCQIAGLKRYLNKDYENLICVDIICHGVPSQKLLREELKENYEKLKYIKFRGKDGFRLQGFDNNKKKIVDYGIIDSKYYDGFLSGLFFRDSCYSCLYAKNDRVSDITLGDYWGISKDSLLVQKSQRISVVLINTDKGNKAFDSIKNDIDYEERAISEAIKGNTQLRRPYKKKISSLIFKHFYQKVGLKKAYVISKPLTCMKYKIRKVIK